MAMPAVTRPAPENLAAVTTLTAMLAGVDPAAIRPSTRFADCGLDSLRMKELAERLTTELGIPVPVTACWKYPTVGGLAAHLGGTQPESTDSAGFTGAAMPRSAVREASIDEPIAVVGVGCRFPAGANPSEFWDALCAGSDAVSMPPPVRRDLTPDDGPHTAAGRKVPERAGYLSVAVDSFDPGFFGISPREASEMDPQQRLLMEVAWEALEDAGMAGEGLAGSATGVYIGAIWHDFADLRNGRSIGPTAHTATGQAANMIANRLSYALGLRGPSLVLDSACSSSLLAVHLACQSLREGESDAAVAGGVNLIHGRRSTASLTAFGGLSPDGTCKAFDAAADGFGRGEGCGVVVLKRLSTALADGDRIWCTINGSAANNDGPSNGLTAPSPTAQEELLRRACVRADVEARQIQYVECHGTGTALGDPIEAEALGAVLGRAGRAEPLVIGSVKTNLGHLEAAAGVAGLIKTVLCLRHRMIPPSLHLRVPNPAIDFDGLGLEVCTELREWPAGPRELAGVSAFGWGGTNVHVVLEGWQEPAAAHPAAVESPVNREAIPVDADDSAAAGRRIGFLCSPHGHGWVGMARAMYRREPAFRASFTRISTEFARHAPVRLAELLFVPEHRLPLEDVRIVQPLQFAVQVAIADWLADSGVRPDFVAGHSLGELSAAVIAELLEVPAAVELLFHYTALQHRVSDAGTGMAVLELSFDEAAALPEVIQGEVCVAAENGPHSTALAGSTTALRRTVEAVKAGGSLASMIPVNVAAHSTVIDTVFDELVRSTADLAAQPGRCQQFSSVDGRRLAFGDTVGNYFARNLRQPVRLVAAVEAMLAAGCDTLVEISANPVLTSALEQTVERSGHSATVLASMRRGEDDRVELYRLRDLLRGEQPAARAQLVTLAARSPAALSATVTRLAEALPLLVQHGHDLADVAQAAARRADGRCRIAVVADDPSRLRGRLLDVGADSEHPDLWSARSDSVRTGRVAFVFPGQGSQWLGMGRELLAGSRPFAASIRRTDAAAADLLDWSITEVLAGTDTDTDIERIDVVQPLLFAIEVALAETWMDWDVHPVGLIGHSMGEVAAAYIAGALTLSDALKVICRRSRLMRRASGRGAMLSVELGVAELADLVAPHEQLVSLAVSNSHRSTVLSGDAGALTAIKAELDARGDFSRWVKVDVASHSPQMDELLPDLRELLGDVTARPGRLPMYSTVTGEIEDGSRLDTEYWCANLRAPVLFAQQVQRLVADGVTAFVEMSPHPILLQAIESVAAETGSPTVAVPSLRRQEGERRTMLASLGQLFVAGVAFDRAASVPAGRSNTDLPTYPWDRQRLWPIELDQPAGTSGIDGTLMLPARLDPAGEPGAHYWQLRVTAETASIGDHQLTGRPLVPGAVHLNLMMAAAADVLRTTSVELTDVTFSTPLLVPSEHGSLVQIVALDQPGGVLLRFYQVTPDGLVPVAEAGARSAHETSQAPFGGDTQHAGGDAWAAERAAGEWTDGATLYSRLAHLGLDFGPRFRGLRSVERHGAHARAEIGIPPGRSGDEGSRVNPGLLDAALLAALATLPADEQTENGMLVTGGIELFRLSGPMPAEATVHTTLRPRTAAGSRTVDVQVRSLDGAVVLQALGVRLVPAGFSGAAATPLTGDPAPAETIHSSLAAIAALTTPAARVDAVQSLIRGQVSRIVRIEQEQIGPHQPLRELGIDSAMSLELRNKLEQLCRLTLPASLIFNYPTVTALAAYLLEELALPAAGATATPAQPRREPGAGAIGGPAAGVAWTAGAHAHDADVHDGGALDLVQLDHELDDLAGWIEQNR